MLSEAATEIVSVDKARKSVPMPVIAFMLYVLGTVALIGGMLGAFVGLNTYQTGGVIGIGLAAAMGGILLVGFGYLLAELHRIELHLRK